MDVISILPILSSLRIATSTVEVHTNPVLYCGQVTRANQVYYENCAPKVTCDPNALYRTYNGACNNLENPLWGSSLTPYLRLAEGVYADGIVNILVPILTACEELLMGLDVSAWKCNPYQ